MVGKQRTAARATSLAKSSPSSSPYGVSPQKLASVAAIGIPTSGDPSQDLLVFLAMAHNAALRLQESGVDLQFDKRLLSVDAIQQAYREAMFLRNKRTPVETMDTRLITKHGRLA